MNVSWQKVLDLPEKERPRQGIEEKILDARLGEGKCFVEVLNKREHQFIHFFVETDGNVKTAEDFDEFMAYVERLETVLDNAVIGGCFDDPKVAEHAKLPHVAGFNRLRAVFPLTKISIETWSTIMKFTASKGWHNAIPAFTSKNAIFEKSRRIVPICLHHICTNGRMADGTEIASKGAILDDDDPKKMLVSVIEDVPEIFLGKLLPLFERPVPAKAASHKREKLKLEDLEIKNPDLSITLNTSDWFLEDVLGRNYESSNVDELIRDLRGVYGFRGALHYIKYRGINGYPNITSKSGDQIRQELDGYKPFANCNTISLYSIVHYYSRYFAYTSSGISKDELPGFINTWCGYAFPEIITDDFKILDPLFKHVREVICNGNEKKYDYIMKWFASIVQKITVKLGTMPIIWGAQGSGKSVLVELMCALMGRSAMNNCDDLDKAFGKFNGLIGEYVLICLNEPPEAGEKFKYTGKIKSKLTQKMILIERKGVDSVEVDCWANYLMTTNNPNPVYEERGQRRFIYFETNNKYCGNQKYFDDLMGPIQPGGPQTDYNPEYMGVLLHYMLTQVDVTGFNPEALIREISAQTSSGYNELLERQYNSLPPLHRWVVDRYTDVWANDTSVSIDIITSYNTSLSAAQAGKQLSSICHSKRTMTKGQRTTYYRLKSRNEIEDFYRIIDYVNSQVEEE